MKKFIQLILIGVVLGSFTFAQQAKIFVEPVTPHKLETLGFTTNSVSTGLNVVPNNTYVYMSALNIGNSEPITSATFTFVSKPATSAAIMETVNATWAQFKPDVKGKYVVNLSITTASGTHDTTRAIYSSDFIGVGNFQGVSGTFPKCMTCHSGDPKFQAIYTSWSASGHGTFFKDMINFGPAYYGTSCFKCHTTGYDHNMTAANGGFDDVAASLGWNYVGPPNPGKWDSLKTDYPGLVNLATIGCESCHGPGSEHATGSPDPKVQTMAVSIESGSCGQCHDEPWRHNRYVQWEQSTHANAVWTGSFAQGSSSQNNSLSNCIRCHDGQGFINFTKGMTTNTTGMVQADHKDITCATCHDPHGNANTYNLRFTPVGSDTLGNGYSYSEGGSGQLCMNCHKARRDNVSYTAGNVTSSHWGPHHSVQTDVLFGQNAASFGTAFETGNHYLAISDACVDCHMVATPDTGTVNRDKVGQHTFKLHNAATGYDHTVGCTGCHGAKTSFSDFTAQADFDYDGTVESIIDEIDGLERLLRIQLPPVGVDSISWQLIRDNNNLDEKKAYWNYQLIHYDGSKGMHNTKFAIDVLTKSFVAIGGIIPVELVSFSAEIDGNVVSLNWKTATETNNQGFDIERRIGNSWAKIGYAAGKGTTTEPNVYTFTDKLSGLQNNTEVFYRLKQVDYDGQFSYSNEVNVTFIGGPNAYELTQNYPNPFNPATVIKYALPYESNVKVVIYNVAGETIKELVNDVQSPGNYEASFTVDGLNLSSGIYFYGIEANSVDGKNSFRQTKKMVLLK